MIHYDMPVEEYFAHPAINSSRAKLTEDTMLDFYENKNGKSTKSKTKGSATHTLLLEPHKFDSLYAVQPEDWGNLTKLDEGKPRWDAFKKENAGKTCLKFRDEGEFFAKLRIRVKQHITLRYLLAIGRPEVTSIVTDPTGLELKARADLLTKDTIYDIKTTSDGLSNEDLYRTIKRYKYEFSAAHYLRVFNCVLDNSISSFTWIFVDTSSPALHIRLVRCPTYLLENGHERVDAAINKIVECQKTNIWPGYPEEIEELELPTWARG